MRPLADLKEGDRVRRMISETVPVDLYVVKLDEQFIYCAPTAGETDPNWMWTFDREFGMEEDERFGWGVKQGVTGSRLIGIVEETDDPKPGPSRERIAGLMEDFEEQQKAGHLPDAHAVLSWLITQVDSDKSKGDE